MSFLLHDLSLQIGDAPPPPPPPEEPTPRSADGRHSTNEGNTGQGHGKGHKGPSHKGNGNGRGNGYGWKDGYDVRRDGWSSSGRDNHIGNKGSKQSSSHLHYVEQDKAPPPVSEIDAAEFSSVYEDATEEEEEETLVPSPKRDEEELNARNVRGHEVWTDEFQYVVTSNAHGGSWYHDGADSLETVKPISALHFEKRDGQTYAEAQGYGAEEGYDEEDHEPPPAPPMSSSHKTPAKEGVEGMGKTVLSTPSEYKKISTKTPPGMGKSTSPKKKDEDVVPYVPPPKLQQQQNNSTYHGSKSKYNVSTFFPCSLESKAKAKPIGKQALALPLRADRREDRQGRRKQDFQVQVRGQEPPKPEIGLEQQILAQQQARAQQRQRK